MELIKSGSCITVLYCENINFVHEIELAAIVICKYKARKSQSAQWTVNFAAKTMLICIECSALVV